jgi:hypothetical protein
MEGEEGRREEMVKSKLLKAVMLKYCNGVSYDLF